MGVFLNINNLEKLYESYPTPTVYAYLASLYLDAGEVEKAIEISKRGIQEASDYPFLHFVLGKALFVSQKYEEARKELEIALSYQDQIPEAWLMIAKIGERFNQPILAKESYLHYYLNSPFNREAAQKFYKEEVYNVLSGEEDLLSTEEEEVVEEVEPNLDSLFEEESPQTELEEEDFQKTFDAIIGESEQKSEEEVVDLLAEQDEAVPEEPEPPQEEEPVGKELSAEEEDISQAIDSILSQLTETEEAAEQARKEADQEEKEQEEIEAMEASEENEVPPEPPEPSEIADEMPEVKFEDEPMDISAVVADIISDREEGEEEAVGPLVEEEGEQEGGEEEEIAEKVKKKPAAEERPKEIPQVEPTGEAPEEEAGTAEEPDKPKFGRPPILTPTLGEIYISQGRFEEAQEVFEKLLEKDPENDRYRRKLEEVKNLIKRKGKK